MPEPKNPRNASLNDATKERAIDRIPPEIWRKIFLALYANTLYQAKTRSDRQYPRDEAIQAVTQTCSLWRRVALDTSYLWHAITYDDLLGLRGASARGILRNCERRFERAGLQQLAVSIEYAPAISPPDAEVPLPDIMKLVIKNLVRIRSLHIKCMDDLTPTGPPVLFDCNPMLLVSRDRPWSGLPMGSLVSLNISGIDLSCMENIRILLRDCYELRRLFILHPLPLEHVDAQVIPPGAIPLPRLSQLFVTTTVAIHLLRGIIVAPRLKELTISTIARTRDWPILPPLLISPTVQRLALCGFERDDLTSMLFALAATWDDVASDLTNQKLRPREKLSQLDLYNCDFEDSISSILSNNTDFGFPMFPNLTTLKLAGMPVKDSVVLSLLDSRTKSSNPEVETLNLQLYGCCTEELGRILQKQKRGYWSADKYEAGNPTGGWEEFEADLAEF